MCGAPTRYSRPNTKTKARPRQCLRHHRRNCGRFSVALAAQKERAEHVREIVSYPVIHHELLGAFLGMKA